MPTNSGQLRACLVTQQVDAELLASTLELAESIYHLHEAGQNYDAELQDLADLTGQRLGKSDVCAAFGSVSEETWARGLLRDHTRFPDDLTHDEMHELLTRILEAGGEEWQDWYWMECLERNTGCDNLTDLINYPDQYFGEDAPDHELSTEEILKEALSPKHRRRRVLITPPPSEPPN